MWAFFLPDEEPGHEEAAEAAPGSAGKARRAEGCCFPHSF